MIWVICCGRLKIEIWVAVFHVLLLAEEDILLLPFLIATLELPGAALLPTNVAEGTEPLRLPLLPAAQLLSSRKIKRKGKPSP